MRKMLPLFVVGILVLSGLGAIAISSDEKSELSIISASFSVPMIEIEKEYITLEIDGTNSYLMKQGKPILPSYSKTFTFPIGTTIKSITATPKNIDLQTLSKPLQPTPQAMIIGQTESTAQQNINYGSEPYPSDWFNYMVRSGIVNGERSIVVETEFSPIKYYPAENSFDFANEVEIVIEYETTEVQQSFLEQYELLVIGPSEYSDEIAPLITHKTGRGLTAKFADLTEVYGGAGSDNQEKIKLYIKDAIETWATTNVLLVGSASKLPSRTVYIYIEDEEPNPEVFQSDLYYADIYDGLGAFCSWNSNGNSKYGEYDWEGNTDEMDLLPDVYFGRWAATTGTQVTTMVNKVKTYENTPAYQQDWFTDLVVVGGDSFPDSGDVDEGEFINEKVIQMMTGFTPNKQWVTNGKLTSTIPNGVTNLKTAINAGCGFVDWSGHGNPTTWATHPHGIHGTWVPTPYPGGFFNSHAGQLTNGNELPIIAVEACSTAKFASNTNCFNWAFLANANGGAIGSFGATALGWGYIGSGVSQGLIGKMGLDTFRGFALDDAVTLGEMWYNALDRFIDSSMDAMDIKTTAEWQSMGDPTLQIGEESNPPAKPNTPGGTTSGKTGTTYTYTTSTTDPDGDQVYYKWDWGDGTFSAWLGPINSGVTASAQKSWNNQGQYEIRVSARDTHGKVSDWSNPLIVNMPRSRSIENIFLQFLQNHPNMFPILRALLGL
jgi:hypothetical protein